MFDGLTSLGYGVIAFAVIVVIGLIIVLKLGDSVASCAHGFTYYGINGTSSQICCNNTAVNCVGVNSSTNYGSATTSAVYFGSQLGTAGLAGWTGAIIAFAIGIMFLGYFVAKRGNRF